MSFQSDSDATTTTKGNVQLAGDLDGTAAAPTIGANKVTASKIETQQAWQTPTLLNSWVNYGSTFATCQYMKDSLGFVHLKGAIKSGTTTIGTTLFTLPAGYRPAEDNYYPGVVTTGGGSGTFQIAPNGNVIAIIVNSGFFSFGQTVFKAEA